MRLVDRVKPPPGGYRYYVAQTNWSITPWVSFDVAVAEIVRHRLGNPYISSQNGWSTDPAVVADELDAFNTAVCQQMGWNAYITEGGLPTAIPKARRSVSSSLQNLARAAGNLVSGVQTIAEWEIAGGHLVEQLLADQRATICSDCPRNVPGDLSSWFTQKAADLIRSQLESRNRMNIETASDDKLGICEACACPLKLKVHTPLDIILSKMSAESKAALDPRCWILKEPQ